LAGGAYERDLFCDSECKLCNINPEKYFCMLKLLMEKVLLITFSAILFSKILKY